MSTSTVPPNSTSSWRRLIQRIRRSPRSADPAVTAHQLDHDLVMSLSTKRIPTLTQLRSIGQVLNPAERRRVSLFGLIGLAALVVLIVNVFLGHLTAVPKNGGTLTEGLVGSPQF